MRPYLCIESLHLKLSYNIVLINTLLSVSCSILTRHYCVLIFPLNHDYIHSRLHENNRYFDEISDSQLFEISLKEISVTVGSFSFESLFKTRMFIFA